MIDSIDEPFSLKPLLAVAIEEAVKWALTDSCLIPDDENGEPCRGLGNFRFMTSEEKQSFIGDIHSMPAISFATMDPGALSQNICNRLLSSGGWTVNGVYAGNASAQQILDASVVRPHYDPIDALRMDLLDGGIRLEDVEPEDE